MALERNERDGAPPVQTWVFLGLAVLGVLALATVSVELGPGDGRAYASRTLPPEPEPVLRAPPARDDEYFPCADCHEDEPTNRRPRELEDDHEDLILAHGDLWCLSCHDLESREQLVLSDDTLVDFKDSWQLCTGCHGTKLADWRAGVHGKRTGHWWGPKEYWSCVACHDPHTPAFEPIVPLPPPRRPEAITAATRHPSQETPDEAE